MLRRILSTSYTLTCQSVNVSSLGMAYQARVGISGWRVPGWERPPRVPGERHGFCPPHASPAPAFISRLHEAPDGGDPGSPDSSGLVPPALCPAHQSRGDHRPSIGGPILLICFSFLPPPGALFRPRVGYPEKRAPEPKTWDGPGTWVFPAACVRLMSVVSGVCLFLAAWDLHGGGLNGGE